MSGSFLAQWARAARVGSVLTTQDVFTLGRIAQALDNSNKHHEQARDAQAQVKMLRMALGAALAAMTNEGDEQ